MKVSFLVNVGTEKYPLYVHPYSVLAVSHHHHGAEFSEVTMNDEKATSFGSVSGSPHEVAKRLLDSMAQGEL